MDGSHKKLTTLVVLAHPEQRSFNGSWAQASVKACEALSHTVLLSDLVATGFDPVEKKSHYKLLVDDQPDAPFDPLEFQDRAAKENAVPMEVYKEIEKIRAADRIIFHFPLWWFGPPAILKGWFDRCLLHGALHSSTQRFDTGMCRDKKALFCVTTGSSAAESSAAGKEGDARMLLWPLAYALRYLGFTVLQPCLIHGVHGFHDSGSKLKLEAKLKSGLIEQKQIMAGFDDLPEINFNPDTDFDESGVLKADAQSYSWFIRHDC